MMAVRTRIMKAIGTTTKALGDYKRDQREKQGERERGRAAKQLSFTGLAPAAATEM